MNTGFIISPTFQIFKFIFHFYDFFYLNVDWIEMFIVFNQNRAGWSVMNGGKAAGL